MQSAAIKNEYFFQDLFVARKVFLKNPNKHIDFGSRVDGFVSNIATFRKVEVFDIRSNNTIVENINFVECDLMNKKDIENNFTAYADSISCLHTIEHLGLGRYGDNIYVTGYKKGIINLSKILSSGGTLYLSTPVGIPRVEFNANWIFKPSQIINIADECGLSLKEMHVYNSTEGIKQININSSNLQKLEKEDYSLCIFIFSKTIN